MSNLAVSTVAQGLLWAVMALGVYVTFRVLDLADLTCEGSFPLGAATAATLMASGHSVSTAILAAAVAGMLAGAVTGFLTTKMKIPALLAGILTMIALYSVNLRIMGKANLSLLGVDTVFTYTQQALGLNNAYTTFVVGLAATLLIGIGMYWFFGTEIGAAIRATGFNQQMIRAQGVNTDMTIILGLIISNALISVSGALVGQNNGFADVGMGVGTIVIGLASVIIGEVLFGTRSFKNCMISVVLGSVVYRIVIAVVLQMGMPPNADQGEVQGQKGGALMLQVEHIYKTFFPGTINEKRALVDTTLHLKPGDFTTVIGSNGAGKSTMLNAIAGVWPIDKGRIVIDGVDITKEPEHKRARYIGRVFQDPMLGTAAGMMIEENLAIASRRGQFPGLSWSSSSEQHDRFYEMLKELNLGLEDRMTAHVGLLSGGQRQALTLLMATIKKPKLLLLDEHTAALDPKTAEKVLELTDTIVERDHLTTLMITHNMRDALRFGNRLIMMHEGRVLIDVDGEEKKNLKIADLLAMFEKASGDGMASDKLLLG